MLDYKFFFGYGNYVLSNNADMAELVDATDLKSVGTLLPCRFDPGFPHHTPFGKYQRVFFYKKYV